MAWGERLQSWIVEPGHNNQRQRRLLSISILAIVVGVSILIGGSFYSALRVFRIVVFIAMAFGIFIGWTLMSYMCKQRLSQQAQVNRQDPQPANTETSPNAVIIPPGTDPQLANLVYPPPSMALYPPGPNQGTPPPSTQQQPGSGGYPMMYPQQPGYYPAGTAPPPYSEAGVAGTSEPLPPPPKYEDVVKPT
ncbi:predicted protein [Nematostella vectensis]|uniref:Uncharacterized protein n=1 Tax=Nematostella vectensis TaxID=45351 RepID=A7S7Q7_NEMVE|nr:predicted protein [Nematostella vectensis]|eukprot:XP_001632300.1 predicted protein [Nematostella vectensis]